MNIRWYTFLNKIHTHTHLLLYVSAGRCCCLAPINNRTQWSQPTMWMCIHGRPTRVNVSTVTSVEDSRAVSTRQVDKNQNNKKSKPETLQNRCMGVRNDSSGVSLQVHRHDGEAATPVTDTLTSHVMEQNDTNTRRCICTALGCNSFASCCCIKGWQYNWQEKN